MFNSPSIRFSPTISHTNFLQATLHPMSTVTRGLSTSRIPIHSLFHVKVNPSPPKMNISQVRWEHMQTTPLIEAENEEKPKKEESINRLIIRRLLFWPGIGALGTICALLIYVFSNADHAKKWVDIIKEIDDVIKNKQAFEAKNAIKDLKLAKELSEKLEALQKSLNDSNLIRIVGNLIKKSEEENEKNIQNIQNEYNNSIARLGTQLIHNREQHALEQNKTTGELNKKVKNLETLISLYKKCLESADFVDLQKFLSATSSELTFEYNHPFGKNFMNILEQALKENVNSSVTNLNLYGSYIQKNNGLYHLMKGLQKNTTIQVLNLKRTDIGQSSSTLTDMTLITEMLKVNHTLREIDLSDNYFKDEDAKKLLEVLRNNKTIKKIDLKNTKVGEALQKQVREALEKNHLPIVT